jgi:hypothetical protein
MMPAIKAQLTANLKSLKLSAMLAELEAAVRRPQKAATGSFCAA